MVQTPRKQSQGFTVQVRMLMELLVRADLGTTTKLHVKKVLTSKQVQNYLKGNQGTTPIEETESNTAGEATMTKSKQAAISNVTAHIPAENRGIVVSTNDDPEEESETDSCPLVPRQRRATQVSESSDSLPLTHLLKRLRTQRPDHMIPTDPIPARTNAPTESLQIGNIDNLTGEVFKDGDEKRDHGSHEQGIGDINLEEGLYQGTHKKHESQSESDLVTTAGASLFTDTILTASNEENIAEQFAHGSEEPETIAPTTDAQI
ncbi:auxin response factor 8-like [Dorcoceras hygrometricum]|uniref:Auxin response factor 8-like n=1 Tax=Dorcoceras hygrometricum TaxID=472368 RepID=A0A2Z7BQA5_9LAMI|nr:auxin response factor 8-like [Dorcoceras hygrometricum]